MLSIWKMFFLLSLTAPRDLRYVSSFNSLTLQISSFFELGIRKSPEDIVKHLNQHLESRMFLVGHSITAADIAVLVHIISYFQALPDYEKLQAPHTFRWLDHVQHLPGLLE